MLSKKSKYAIKALVALARNAKNNTPMRIAEISERENIPKKFLETILLDLRRYGVLGSKIGVNGGYYLIKKPSDIILTDIIRLTDGPIALVPCVSLNFYEKCDDCEDEVVCGLRKVMTDLRKASLNVLSNNSIADIVKTETQLIRRKRKI
ncbi:MAG TPA: Rrf2 family transcriptional regulator [Bacteroidia bacterium]|jgi:Rrf2 family protein|nr:Rrf2 family transcriptional regulator [Bacteroidia bacterium]